MQFATDGGAENFTRAVRKIDNGRRRKFCAQQGESAQEDYSKEYNVAEKKVQLTKKIFDTTIKQGEFFPTVKVTGTENRLATSPCSFTGKK